MKKGVIVIIVILLLTLIGALFYFNYVNNPSQKNSQNLAEGNNIGSDSNLGSTTNKNNVIISGFEFSQATINIGVGDEVIWTNEDGAPHTVTSDSGSELSSARLSNSESYSHVFTKPGTYNYHCEIHSSMKGKVIVS